MAFTDYLSQTFPGIRITSGKRGPNSALGRANPRSYHNVGMAWDTAPVQGMSYDDYLNRIKSDGWNVLEARDEVNNPSRYATGPHWHVAVDGRKEQQPMATNRLADLMAGIAPMARQEEQQGLAGLLQNAPSSIVAGDQQPIQLPMDKIQIKKPGAFSQGGNGWKIMGIIGDALQTAGGGKATYAPYVADQQERADNIQLALQKLIAERQGKQEDRAAQLQDNIFMKQWERDHPSSPADAQMMAWYNGLSPEQKAQYAAMKDVQNPIAVSGPTGTYRVPRTFGQPSNGPTPGTVEDGHVYIGGDPSKPSSWRAQ